MFYKQILYVLNMSQMRADAVPHLHIAIVDRVPNWNNGFAVQFFKPAWILN